MARVIRVAAAQLGPTNKWDPREQTLERMIKLLEQAAEQKADIVCFPETAFTTFFPRYLIETEEELLTWYEHGEVTQSKNVKPFFDKAKELQLAVCAGYGEYTLEGEKYNTCIMVGKDGNTIAKYRKVHLPGTFEPFDDPKAFNQLEKRYFLPGNLGFKAFRLPGVLPTVTNGKVNGQHHSTNGTSASGGPPAGSGDPICGMMICNDRRWAEAWRSYGLQGVELVMCGYNTLSWAPHLFGHPLDRPKDSEAAKQLFHHKLSMQAFSYTNATFSVCAARCGNDDGKYHMIGGSMVIDPEGLILAEAKTEADEIIVADCDLAACEQGQTKTFNFKNHRRTEHYGIITEQTGAVRPPLL